MSPNDFASALKSRAASPSPSARSASPSKSAVKRKHIGGYFSPAVAKQLRLLATEKETTLQELLAEALTLLFAKRGLSMPSS